MLKGKVYSSNLCTEDILKESAWEEAFSTSPAGIRRIMNTVFLDVIHICDKIKTICNMSFKYGE
jgi:hypothetical protein